MRGGVPIGSIPLGSDDPRRAERWRARWLRDLVFEGVGCRELIDPRRRAVSPMLPMYDLRELVYVSFWTTIAGFVPGDGVRHKQVLITRQRRRWSQINPNWSPCRRVLKFNAPTVGVTEIGSHIEPKRVEPSM